MLIDYKKANIDQQDGQRILNAVDFTVEDGAFVYIIGRVGSGKSSLLKTIYNELDIDEAERAVVLDYDMTSIRRKEVPALRRQIGIVFQDFQLLADRSVFKNLSFVLKATGWKDKEERRQRIEEVLEAVGMSDKSRKMPHELSGGEQQRIAIARAILNHPRLIVADEPTGNLDPETAAGIMHIFKDIAQQGTAVVMSTHNMPLLDQFPGVVYRCCEGRFEEVTGDDRKMEAVSDDNE
ncbi:MAG: ATP-binding cassette domain-containing protein [Prevotella sp.]|nr:ATP-binding cassette domain-containing protein [Prevotella sp.]